MKYRYEFEIDEDFVKGHCYNCPLAYVDYNDRDWNPICVLQCRYDECPLEKVEE